MFIMDHAGTQNRRKAKRFKCSETLVLNPEGACEIIEISSGGFSFKCLFGQSLLGEWSVDIIDNRGGYLKKVMVEKVWQADEALDSKVQMTSSCPLAVGVKFKNLSAEQHATLNKLVQSNEIH